MNMLFIVKRETKGDVKMFLVYDYDGDMISEVETEEEAKKLAEDVFGYYEEA